MNKKRYMDVRRTFLSNIDDIVRVEKENTVFLLQCIMDSIELIHKDFDEASDLIDFWWNNPPRVRGRKPRGDKIPWKEVAESTLIPRIVQTATERRPGIKFPGLPAGADVWFLSDNHFIHLDAKATGDSDNSYEVVASPNQISGDGAIWKDGAVDNQRFLVVGPRGGETDFKAELPPIYCINGSWVPCGTFFLKANYQLIDKGIQPLDYLELSCVPNGLLLFDGPNYAEKLPGLLTSGKDGSEKANPRTRVKLDPLADIAPWRSIKIYLEDSNWTFSSRAEGKTMNLFP